jgi:glutathione S-transferase
MALPKLIYFAARGRAELIRLTLAEGGMEYQDETFSGAEAFAALKASGRLPFGAVPVWEEPDGFRLAQSQAIASHVARAGGLHGKSPREIALCEQMLGAFEDVRQEMRRLNTVEPAKRADLRAELLTTSLPRWFGQLDAVLQKNRSGEGYLVGESVTLADLAVFYLVELASDNGFAGALADRPRLKAHFDRTRARPRLAEYLGSPRRFPFQPLPK